MLFKLSNVNANLAITLGYLNAALNNSAQEITVEALLATTLVIESVSYTHLTLPTIYSV